MTDKSNSTALSSLEQMARLVDDGTLSDAVEVLKDKLKAKKRVRSKDKRGYDDVDDNTTQMKAAELLITFRLGRPAATNLNLNLNQNAGDSKTQSAEQVVSQLAGNSDLGKILEIVQRNAAIEMKQAEPVDPSKYEENEQAIDI